MAKPKRRPNPAAATLGRLGGKARKKKLTKVQLSASGRNAVNARWARARGEKPPAKEYFCLIAWDEGQSTSRVLFKTSDEREVERRAHGEAKAGNYDLSHLAIEVWDHDPGFRITRRFQPDEGGLRGLQHMLEGSER